MYINRNAGRKRFQSICNYRPGRDVLCYRCVTVKQKNALQKKEREKGTCVEIARCLIFSWRGEFSISTATDINCRLYIDSLMKYRLRLCVVARTPIPSVRSGLLTI